MLSLFTLPSVKPWTQPGAVMFSLFKKDPTRRLRKDYERKVEQAFQAQQNSNVRLYSERTAEAEAIKEQILALEAATDGNKG